MKSSYRHPLSIAIAAACAVGSWAVVSPASAQEQQEQTRTSGSVAAADPEVQELDKMIVTAERREQDPQDYAGAVQSLSSEDLRGLGINNELRNVQVAIPGLSIANQEGNVEIYLRGVGSANNTELGDPATAPHINGVYIPRARGLGGMFYDLERVEITKGPQGTLRGRNALGGTLNIITKRPEIGGPFGGYVQLEAGNRDHRGGEFGVDLPVGEWAGLRVSGYKIEKDSSFENAGFSGADPAGIQDDGGARVSFLYEPGDESGLSVFVMADKGWESGTGYPGANIYAATCSSDVTCGGRPGSSPEDLDLRKVIYRGPQGDLDSTNWGLMTSVLYDFGPVTLEYGGSWRKLDFEQRNASSNGILYPGRNIDPVSPDNPGGEDYDNFSTQYWLQTSDAKIHELRLFSSDEDARLNWSGGVFHFEEDQTSGFFSMVDKGNFYSGTEFTMPVVRAKSSAAYADGTFEFSDRFRMKAGIRYTEEDKYRYGIGGNWTIGLGAGNGCCFTNRLGTEGFMPAFTSRPNFDVTGLSGNADFARFILEGILTNGARDTLFTQIGGIADGTVPNGTCIDRPDIGGDTLDCPPNGQHSFVVLGIPGQQIGRSDFSFTDGRLGFEYDFTPDNLFYGTVSTGHKAGGFNDSFDPEVIPETYEPESIVAYEVGSKNAFRLFDRLSTFNASAFYYDYSDQVFQDLGVVGVDQNGDPTGFALVNRNIGSSRIYGLELQSTLRLPAGFSLDLNALYLDTKIEEGVVADARSTNFGTSPSGLSNGGITSLIDLSGNELPLSSKFTAAARLQHVIELGAGSFDWQVLVSYRSSFYLTQFNERDVVFVDRYPEGEVRLNRIEDAQTAGFPDQQEGATQINAGLGFTSLSGAWRFEAWGSNLTNEDISQKEIAGGGLNLRFLNDARSYGMRVRYNF